MTQRIGIMLQSVTSMPLEKLGPVRSPTVNLSQFWDEACFDPTMASLGRRFRTPRRDMVSEELPGPRRDDLWQWGTVAKSWSQTADKSGTRSATSGVIGFNQSHLQTAGSLRWEAHRITSVVPSVPPSSLLPRMGISGKLL